MLKEIYEQPTVVGDILTAYANPQENSIHLPIEHLALAKVKRIYIVACGTSYYAGLVAKNWLEKTVGIATEVDVASEFRYRTPPLTDVDLCIFISQSGETADTLSAMLYAKTQGKICLALVNVPESTLARECHGTIELHAGPEIGVASTKAFTAQLTVLACLTIYFIAQKNTPESQVEKNKLLADLMSLPNLLQGELEHDKNIHDLAKYFIDKQHAMYIGRGTGFALAAEGALKLKELSYIHAEAYGAGELKHGPIALIDAHMPVVALVSSSLLMDKMSSNIQEILSREGDVILLADEKAHQEIPHPSVKRIIISNVSEFLTPFIFTIPQQLLAYHVASLKGTDVDQPRNLAKSVTVE
jgi:glucosamine--fructose-6-phosphate aminotransferase (isomerizing)